MFHVSHIFLISSALLLSSHAPSAPSDTNDDGFGKDFTGKKPPELIVPKDGWITWNGGELSLEKLNGHVVWLEFSYVDCGGCRMMKPILQGFQKVYGPKGLVVIEVNHGGIDPREKVVKQAEKYDTNYALFWDKNGATCKKYGVSTFGSAYLIGVDGKVIWSGNPLALTVDDLAIAKAYLPLLKVKLEELKKANDPFLVSDLRKVTKE